MFKEEGTFMAVVDDAKLATSRFAKGPNEYDVCLHVVRADDSSQMDWWRGELSDEPIQTGIYAGMLRKEVTLLALRKTGFEGSDFSALRDQYVGKKIPITVRASEKDGRTYYNVKYIGGGGDVPEELSAEEVRRRTAILFGPGSAKGNGSAGIGLADHEPQRSAPVQEKEAASNPFLTRVPMAKQDAAADVKLPF